jgi:hypothetical protein
MAELHGIRRCNVLSQPLVVVTASFIAATLFALLIVASFQGDVRAFWLYYYLPIGLPFIAFLLDRASSWHARRWMQRVIDLVVLVLSLARAVAPVPLISGHAFFLVYALLTTRSQVARIMAVAVLLEVAYLKLFVWHDATFFGGAAAGCGAALLYSWLRRKDTSFARGNTLWPLT